MQNLEVQRPQSQASTARLSGKSAERSGSLSSPKSTNTGDEKKVEESEVEHQVETPVSAIPIDSKPNAEEKGNEEEKEKDKEDRSPLVGQLPTMDEELTDNLQTTQTPQPNSESPVGEPTRISQNQTSDESQVNQTPVEETVSATNVCNLQENPTEQSTHELIQQTPTPIPPQEEITRALSSEDRNINTPINSNNISDQESILMVDGDKQTENQDENSPKSEESNNPVVSPTNPISPNKEVSESSLSENKPNTEDTNNSALSPTKPTSPNKEIGGSPMDENNINTGDTTESDVLLTKPISPNKELSETLTVENYPKTEDSNESALTSSQAISPNNEVIGSPLDERQGTPAIEVA